MKHFSTSNSLSGLLALLLQVTIRASLTGKGSFSTLSPDLSTITISTEPAGTPLFKSPANVSKSKANNPGAKKSKDKMEQNEKQERRISKNNLTLRNLRLVAKCFHHELSKDINRWPNMSLENILRLISYCVNPDSEFTQLSCFNYVVSVCYCRLCCFSRSYIKMFS